MSENKQYILIPFEEGNLIFKDDGREFFNSVDCLKDNEIVDLLNEQDKLIRELRVEVEVHKHPLFSTRQAEEKIERYESDLRMCREKALYWRNKAEDIFGDMRTNVELKRENEKLKEELESFEQVSFTDLCDGSRTVLYMKKENVGDVE